MQWKLQASAAPFSGYPLFPYHCFRARVNGLTFLTILDESFRWGRVCVAFCICLLVIFFIFVVIFHRLWFDSVICVGISLVVVKNGDGQEYCSKMRVRWGNVENRIAFWRDSFFDHGENCSRIQD